MQNIARKVFDCLLCAGLLLSFGPALAAQDQADNQPDYGGRIIMGMLSDAQNLISYMTSDASSQEISGWLFIAPLKYDKDMNTVLYAAESWEVLDEGRHMRFTMRDDLVWQDGHPLTVDDIYFTYRLMIDPNTATVYSADFLNIKEFRQTGPLTFEVFYDAPYARSTVTWMLPILPKHILEGQDINNTSFARNPIGAGPFKLERWDSGSMVVLEANDLYFEGRPYLDQVIYRVIPDLNTIFMEAQAGNVDFISLTPQQYLFQTSGPVWERAWNKYQYLSFGYTYLGFNLESPFFEDKRVRQALNLAVDKQAIISGALFGLGEPTIGPYKPGTWVYNDALEPYPYDPGQAAALLADAGWLPGSDGILVKDGLPFRFTLLVNQGNEERIKVATVLQQYFKEIGVQMEVRTVEWAAFLNEFILPKNFDAAIMAWNILEDPDIYDVWHSSAMANNGLNFVSFNNPEADEMLEKGRATADQDERKAYYDRFQEIVHEEQPYMFLFVPYALPMVQSRFQDVEPAPAGISHNFERWWIPQALQ